MESPRDDRNSSSAPLLGSTGSKSVYQPSAPGYNTLPPAEEYYYDDYDDEDVFLSSKHMSKHKYTYWTVIALLTIPLIYFYFQMTLGIEPNYIRVPDLVRVESLKPPHSPSHRLGKRVIVIGDVHGKMKSLKKLLDKAEYNETKDHIVFLGDMISKGPNSIAVLDFAISVNASCVRGNHEDNILNQYAGIHKLPMPKVIPSEGTETEKDVYVNDDDGFIIGGSDKAVSRKLKPEHIQYLGTCPAILELGNVGFYDTKAVAVHAGLQWNIENLQEQDPSTVFTMRSLLPPTYTTASEEMEGTHWAKIWNEKQKEKHKSARLSVFYGHDARNGLNLRKYTAGLDTGCVSGGELSALIISETRLGKVIHEIRSVRC